MSRRAWAWGVPAAVLVLAALGSFYATSTPRYALYRLGVAMQRHDVASAERYFDVERIADRATEVIVADYLARRAGRLGHLPRSRAGAGAVPDEPPGRPGLADQRVRPGMGAPPGAGRAAADPLGRSAVKPATTFRSSRSPTSPSSDMMDSGWNCTAASGRRVCSTAMTIPSSLSAVTSSVAGSFSRIAKSEW